MASDKKNRKKNGKPSITVRVRMRGISLCRTFPDRKSATRWKVQVESEIDGGRTSWAALDYYCTRALSGKGKPGQARAHVEFWRGALGDLPISEVNSDRIADAVKSKLSDLSPSTVNAYLVTLSSVFSGVIRLKWVLWNPVTAVPRETRPKARERIRALTVSEQARFLEVCRKSSCPALYPVVLLALCTGAGKDELRQLDWSAVDLSRGLVSLRTWRSGVLRPVSLPSQVVEVLRGVGDSWRSGSGLCFPSSRGLGPVDLRHAWEVAVREAGVGDLRFEDLRSTMISRWESEGASLEVIAQFLGVKSSLSLRRHAKPFFVR